MQSVSEEREGSLEGSERREQGEREDQDVLTLGRFHIIQKVKDEKSPFRRIYIGLLL